MPRHQLRALAVILFFLAVPAVLLMLSDNPDTARPLEPVKAAPEVVVSEPKKEPAEELPELSNMLPFADDVLPSLPELLAEDAKEPGPIKYSLIQRPADGIDAATEDILRILQKDQPFMRYFWFSQPTALSEANLNYALNTAVSHSQVPVKVRKINNNLYCVDLRLLCPDPVSFQRMFALWETKLEGTDFWFHTLREQEIPVVEKRTVKENKTVTENQTVTTVDRFQRPIQSVQPVTKTVEVDVVKDFTVTKKVAVNEFAIHTGLDKTLLLASLTQSKAPIVNGTDFIVRSLSTIEGGLYYDFVGMPKSVAGKRDVDAFVELLGGQADPEKRKQGASYVGLFRSKVTNKPRQIEYFYGTTSRPSVGPQLITLTHDLTDEDVDPKQHPIRNLLNFKGSAIEAIGTRNNGTFIYSLYDANGKLLDEAPANLVKDHTIPSPYPSRLQPAISCIRCHGPDTGRKSAANNVAKLTKGSLRVLDDESSKNDVQHTLDLLAGMYKGDLLYPLTVTRNTHAQSIFLMTNGKSVPQVSQSLGDLHIEYMYGPITPKKAVADLGYFVETDIDAVRLIQRILPPLPPNAYGVSTEDPVIATLREWDPEEPVDINRLDWLQVLSDAMLRVITEEARIKAENPATKQVLPPLLPKELEK